ERAGQLVATQVVRADHHRVARERLAHASEVRGLLVFAWQRRVTRDQKLRAQQPDAFGAMLLRGLELVREVHVAPQRDAHAIGRDRGLRGDLVELSRQLAPAQLAPAALGDLAGSANEPAPPAAPGP